MKRSLLFACALTLSAAANAPAGAFTHTVQMQASAPTACSFTAVPEAAGTLLSVTSATASVFTLPIDAVQARVTTLKSDALTFEQAYCNATTNVSLTRLGFKHVNAGSQGPLPDGIVNEIQYGAILNWGTGSPIVNLPVGGSNSGSTSIGARSTEMTLEITVPPTATLVAGTYADTLTLVVTSN